MTKPIFNAGKVFDVSTGLLDATAGTFDVSTGTLEPLLNGTPINEYIHPPVINPKSNTSFYTYCALDAMLRKTKGGTVERFTVAVKLLVLMGFIVKWDGTTKEPEVTWFDFEGWSSKVDIPEMIRDILNKEYSTESIDNGTSFGLISAFKTDNKETVITLDSFSKLS